jgi:hypothetical protein
MAIRSHKDLNNYNGGSYFVRDMLDEMKSTGRRTHYYKEGINTVGALSREALAVSQDNFPGSDIPLSAVKMTKLDGGRAIRVDEYARRTPNPLAYSLHAETSNNTPWYILSIKEWEQVLNPLGSNNGHRPSAPTEPPIGFKFAVNWRLSIPFETSTFPFEKKITRMIGKTNNAIYNVFPGKPEEVGFPRGCLMFNPPEMKSHIQADGSELFRGTYQFMFRTPLTLPGEGGTVRKNVPGFSQLVKHKGGKYQLILEYEETKFTELPGLELEV